MAVKSHCNSSSHNLWVVRSQALPPQWQPRHLTTRSISPALASLVTLSCPPHRLQDVLLGLSKDDGGQATVAAAMLPLVWAAVYAIEASASLCDAS